MTTKTARKTARKDTRKTYGGIRDPRRTVLLTTVALSAVKAAVNFPHLADYARVTVLSWGGLLTGVLIADDKHGGLRYRRPHEQTAHQRTAMDVGAA